MTDFQHEYRKGLGPCSPRKWFWILTRLSHLSWVSDSCSIRSDEGLALEMSAFESLYDGQFTSSTQLIKPNYLVILPTMQHHSFFNLPPLLKKKVTDFHKTVETSMDAHLLPSTVTNSTPLVSANGKQVLFTRCMPV